MLRIIDKNLEFFAKEVIVSLCSTGVYNIIQPRLAPTSFRKEHLLEIQQTDSASEVLLYVLNRLIDYTNPNSAEVDCDQKQQQQQQETSLVLSRAAAQYGNWKRSHDNPTKYDAPEHLSAAACVGNLSPVEHVKQDHCSVSAESDLLGTPLLSASRNGHLEIVRLLLNNGVDWEAGYRRGAIRLRECNVWSLQEHFFVGIESPYTVTVLEAAASKGDEQIVQLLLQQPSRHNWRSSYSHRAITFAATRGKIDLVRLLVEEISEVHPLVLKDPWNHTLLATAYSGKTEVIPFLLAKGAQIDSTEFYERNHTTALGSPLFGPTTTRFDYSWKTVRI